MKLVPVLLVISISLLSRQCKAYQMTRCQLVHELRRQGFPEDLMRDWVCLVENQSSRMTDKARPSYGLFQISDKFWCSNTGTPGKDCNVTCAEMMTDDITKAAACAKKIYKRHKFQAWNAWRDHCSGKPLPDISDC